MLIRLKEIKTTRRVFLHHSLLFALSFSLFIPFGSPYASMGVFFSVGICTLFIIGYDILFLDKRYKSKNTKGIKKYRKSSKYAISVFLMYAVSILTLCIVVCTFVGSYIASAMDYAFIFLLIHFLFFYVAMQMYILNTSDFLEKEKKMIVWCGRAIWLLCSFLILNVSISQVMGYMDITFSQASTKMTIYSYFIILVMALAMAVMILVNITLLIHEGKTISVRNSRFKNVFYVRYDSLPILMPALFSFVILLFCYYKNELLINNFIFTQTIEMDSVERFYCGGEYRLLNNYKGARFMLVSEGKYRAFLPYEGGWYSYRLDCKVKPPYYEMKYILSRANENHIKIKTYELKKDMEIILKS
ncbi:hypothetical protein FEM41_17850 [Jejubacter calystegiae]|uniref:Uncharacterized protein n=1 Tax=Jejubacter calystegiae TaxID=2579935 RepID=A0A4V1G7Z6_9ENTR|nr:hypothetical protein [Jejubacter calystegiae]QCT21377.1 hypothetical protein FEM41_17850 [Jejubacter calystegiae]